MSNINDICCNPRLHNLVLAGWAPCCASSSSAFVVGVRRRPRRSSFVVRRRRSSSSFVVVVRRPNKGRFFQNCGNYIIMQYIRDFPRGHHARNISGGGGSLNTPGVNSSQKFAFGIIT